MKRIIILFIILLSFTFLGCNREYLKPFPGYIHTLYTNFDFKNFYISPLDCNMRYKTVGKFSIKFSPAMIKYQWQQLQSKIIQLEYIKRWYNQHDCLITWALHSVKDYINLKKQFLGFEVLNSYVCLKTVILMLKSKYRANGIINYKFKEEIIFSLYNRKPINSFHDKYGNQGIGITITISGIAIRRY